MYSACMYVRTEEYYECALTVKVLQPGGINIMLNRQPLNVRMYWQSRNGPEKKSRNRSTGGLM